MYQNACKSKQFINELKQLIGNRCQEADNATDIINVYLMSTEKRTTGVRSAKQDIKDHHFSITIKKQVRRV